MTNLMLMAFFAYLAGLGSGGLIMGLLAVSKLRRISQEQAFFEDRMRDHGREDRRWILEGCERRMQPRRTSGRMSFED